MIAWRKGTRCVLVAGHGMGPIYHASWNLTEILDSLVRPPGSTGTAHGGRGEVGRDQPVAHPEDDRAGLGNIGSRPSAIPAAGTAPLPLVQRGQRWRGRRAFAIPNNDSVGAIRVSVRGRDLQDSLPGRRVSPGLREHRRCLTELKDPVSGRPVVRKVTLTHDVFSVRFSNSFRHHGTGEQDFPGFDRVSALRKTSDPAAGHRTGSHTHGVLHRHRSWIPAGIELNGHSIYDIAPTVREPPASRSHSISTGHPCRCIVWASAHEPGHSRKASAFAARL